jgi:hypothetical protein
VAAGVPLEPETPEMGTSSQPPTQPMLQTLGLPSYLIRHKWRGGSVGLVAGDKEATTSSLEVVFKLRTLSIHRP